MFEIVFFLTCGNSLSKRSNNGKRRKDGTQGKLNYWKRKKGPPKGSPLQYGHLLITDSSFGPKENKAPINSISVIWTPTIRTLISVFSVSVLKHARMINSISVSFHKCHARNKRFRNFWDWNNSWFEPKLNNFVSGVLWNLFRLGVKICPAHSFRNVCDQRIFQFARGLNLLLLSLFRGRSPL